MRIGADPRARLLRAGAQTLIGVILIVLALAGSACTAGPKPPKARTPLVIYVYVPIPPRSMTCRRKPKPKPDPVQLTLVGCSHGTVGISVVNAPGSFSGPTLSGVMPLSGSATICLFHFSLVK